jgi:hypothetical protein
MNTRREVGNIVAVIVQISDFLLEDVTSVCRSSVATGVLERFDHVIIRNKRLPFFEDQRISAVGCFGFLVM